MQANEKRGQMVYTIDLIHVLKSVWRWMWAILLAGILAAGGAFGYSNFVAEPQYSAQVRMMVQNGTKTESADGKTEYDWAFTAAELAAAQSLVKTYMHIMKGHVTMSQVVGRVNEVYQTDLGYTPEDLAKRVTMKAVADTELLEITVTVEDPNKAAAIANCIAEVLPQRVEVDLGLKPLRLVDEARINTEPVSPNKTKNTVLGFAVGAMLAALVVAAFAIADGSVHDEDFALKTYNYPILAKIPPLVSDSSTGNKYYKEHSSASTNEKEG